MEIGGIKFRNQFIMSAVKTGYGTAEGVITDRHVAFWNERSRHAAAVIFEPFYIDKQVRELPTQIGIDNDDKIEGHKKLIAAAHNNGALAVAHINHPGRMANPLLPGNIYLSASAVQCPNGGKLPKEMSPEDITSVQKQYIDAAVRAQKAGYDLIELQFGLGYLISQFISADTNKRSDNYGGSFENRMRFGVEILRGIKSTVKLPVIVRISGDEKAAGGLTIDDTLLTVKAIESEKADAIHVTSGNVCLSAPWYYQHHFIPKGATWQMAKQVKRFTSLPVITVGQINDFEDVDKIFNENAADFIALGRTLIADPDFIGKYLKQVDGNVRPCSSCLTGCLGRIKIGKGLQCEINPEVGKELEPLTKAHEKKHYAVVGGGLAGMQAAKTLKERGHIVTLFEKDKLGGQFTLAPLPSGKISLQKQIDYLKAEIKDVEIINREAGENDLIGKYHGVVLASGSRPFIPDIPGLKEYSWAEILYEFNMPANKNVMVIGGGLIGIEVANTLIDHGNSVIIVEMLDEVARGMEMVTKKLNLMKLQKNNVKIYTNTKVTEIEGGKVYLKKLNDENFVVEGIDVFVVAAGMKPEKELLEKLEGKIPVHVIGDAGTVGDAVFAVQSAYFTCKQL